MQPVQSVAIIGAGNMGSGIAQKTAQEEFDVQMVDREAKWVERGQTIIADFLSEAVERRIFSPDQVEQIKGRITGVVGTENTAADTDLVIEAVFEDFDIKSTVFNTLNEVCGEGTILASNTSSLSVNELALASGRPDRFVGLHFFYHPAKNRLVEVIPGEDSSQDTIARTVQYCRGLGKGRNSVQRPPWFRSKSILRALAKRGLFVVARRNCKRCCNRCSSNEGIQNRNGSFRFDEPDRTSNRSTLNRLSC